MAPKLNQIIKKMTFNFSVLNMVLLQGSTAGNVWLSFKLFTRQTWTELDKVFKCFQTHSINLIYYFLCSSRGLCFMLFDGAAIPYVPLSARLPICLPAHLPILVSYSETRSCWLVCGHRVLDPIAKIMLV